MLDPNNAESIEGSIKADSTVVAHDRLAGNSKPGKRHRNLF